MSNVICLDSYKKKNKPTPVLEVNYITGQVTGSNKDKQDKFRDRIEAIRSSLDKISHMMEEIRKGGNTLND